MTGCTKVLINPFTGKLDVYKEANTTSTGVTDLRQCLASVSVGDLVMESSTIVNRVDVPTNNTDVRPVIGIVIDKPSTTEATILLVGVFGGFSGLVKSKKVFLSTTGELTSTPPATGYVQTLGVAKEESILDFNPQLVRVKRI